MSSITIKDIARESGFAVSTVSRALNNHPDVSRGTKEKIQGVIDSYNFVPNNNAKKLKQQAASSIAIIIKGRFNSMFASILENLQERLTFGGFHSEMHFIDEISDEVQHAVRIINENKPIAIIFLGGDIDAFKEGFSQIGIPCVLITNSAASLGFLNLSSVCTDDVKAAYCAAEYIIKSGHSEIGIIGGNLEKSFTSRLRFKGYMQCFNENKINFDIIKSYQKARFSFKSSYNAMSSLLAGNPDITAVLTMSDVMAIGAIRALADCGKRVPEDISVMGFDGIELSWFYTPRLSTIEQSQEQLALRGADILVSAIRNSSAAVHEEISFKLIEGESVKKLYQN